MPNIEAGLRHVLPWFLPGTLVSAIVGLIVSRPFGRLLREGPVLAWALVVSFGMVVSATLTPLHGLLNPAAIGGTCDFSRIGLAPLHELSHLTDTSLNILLFVPFGVTIGLVQARRPKAILLVFAIALPPMIETTQLLIPAIERGCQSADVFDNWTGLVVGLVFGTLGLWLAGTMAADSPGSAS